MIRAYDGIEPEIADSAYVDPEATVIGDVTIGPDATVLPGAVIRGDGGPVVLEAKANVQDNATIHADENSDGVLLREGAAMGHNAIVHNATLGTQSLVGMHATVLDDVVLEPHSAVAAGSLVPEGRTIETGTVVAGTPAELFKEGVEEHSSLFMVGAYYAGHVDDIGTEPVEKN